MLAGYFIGGRSDRAPDTRGQFLSRLDWIKSGPGDTEFALQKLASPRNILRSISVDLAIRVS